MWNQSTVEIQLPEDLSGFKKLSVFVLQGNKKLRWFSGKVENIRRKWNMPQYFVDYLDVDFQEKKMYSQWLGGVPVTYRYLCYR